MAQGGDINGRIGTRIRAEREARGWSLTDLAGRAAVSRAMIHKVERGASSPTAQLLGKLSGAFGLTMSTLIARAEAGSGRLLRRQDQPEWTDPETGYLRRHVTPVSGLPLDLVQVTLPAGQAVPMPAASYAFIRQVIWVLDGALVFEEGAARHRMDAGDCLELGPPVNCVFRNETDRPCTYAVVVLRDTTGSAAPDSGDSPARIVYYSGRLSGEPAWKSGKQGRRTSAGYWRSTMMPSPIRPRSGT